MPEQGNIARTWLTIEEAAATLAVHHNTVRRAIKLKELRAKKLGGTWRIEREDLQKYEDSKINVKPAA